MMPRATKDKVIYLSIQLAMAIVIAYFLVGAAFPQKNPVFTPTVVVPSPTTTAPVVSSSTPDESTTIETPIKVSSRPFENLRLTAGSAIVYDLTTGQTLFRLREQQKRPIASITKVMTAYAASLALTPETEVTISAADAQLESSAGLVAGERWRLSDLSNFTLVSSSNGGAQAIARTMTENTGRDFIDEMNQVATEIGLENTKFRNETGLDLYDSQISGSYSTAYDLARLFTHIINTDPTLLAATTRNQLTVYSLDRQPHQAFNTDLLVAKVPNILASKTGLTDLAGGSLALAVEPVPGHPLVIVVLGSTAQGRFTDVEKLITEAKRDLTNQ
ncbi:MAG: serine hydrolase [Candidatus Vogelbacteria bacterium]|nr:serine hydrolase [Candidatus Vogelbacteria bacterium]